MLLKDDKSLPSYMDKNKVDAPNYAIFCALIINWF